MILRCLEAGPLVTYQRLSKCPPATGITVIVGDNGAGKSLWYEAVAWALHGKTVRGPQINDAHVEVQVEVAGEVYTIERQRSGRSHKLRLACGALDLSGATPTETQRRIDAIVGTHERLCAGRVFARDLLAKFGLATDKERKALLEEVLGLQQFDRALVQCRADLAQADVKRSLADQAFRSAKQRDYDALARVEALKERRTRSIAEVQAELDTVQEEHRAAKEAWLARMVEFDRLNVEVNTVEGEAYRLERLALANEQNVLALQEALAHVEEGCIACGRPFDPSVVEAERNKILGNLAGYTFDRKALVQARAKAGLVREEREEMAAAFQLHEQQQRMRRERHTELKGELELATRAAEDYSEAVGVQTDTESAMWDADAALSLVTREHLVLKAADQALGLKGARVLLLSRALLRLGQEANLVLARLHPTLRVKVQVNEKEGVDVVTQGAGGGDYRACSGGQRVLVDVALMLGLAALQGGSGLVVFDEVFDSLDRRAVEAVAEYLQEVARERQVVVISHREDLTAMFRCAAKWRARVDGDFSVMEDA